MMNSKRLALFSSVIADLGRVEQFLRNKDTREACDVPCEYFAELFSDLDDEIKALKAENDLIKEDLTRLTIENVEQNSKINSLQSGNDDQNAAIESNSVLISTIDDSVSNLSESLQDTQDDMMLLTTQVKGSLDGICVIIYNMSHINIYDSYDMPVLYCILY